MSISDNYNLAVQDFANEMGFDTTQELLDYKERKEMELAEVTQRLESLQLDKDQLVTEITKLRNGILSAATKL